MINILSTKKIELNAGQTKPKIFVENYQNYQMRINNLWQFDDRFSNQRHHERNHANHDAVNIFVSL